MDVGYSVKRVADLAGVSVRTMHHYDAIGLVCPHERSGAGYRIYSRADLERLQQVLFFRELGLALEEIKAIVEDPAFDRRQALLDHRELLSHRRDRIDRLIRAVDRTLASMREGTELEERIMFDGFDNVAYAEEARQRWGHTEAYKESQRRTARYSEADWTAIQAEQTDILRQIADLADRAPGEPEVQRAVQRMHAFIDELFYTCSRDVFRGIGDLAAEDERFTATYEKLRPGLAAFFQQAVHIYCERPDIEG